MTEGMVSWSRFISSREDKPTATQKITVMGNHDGRITKHLDSIRIRCDAVSSKPSKHSMPNIYFSLYLAHFPRFAYQKTKCNDFIVQNHGLLQSKALRSKIFCYRWSTLNPRQRQLISKLLQRKCDVQSVQELERLLAVLLIHSTTIYT